jgi:hypothetical protein
MRNDVGKRKCCNKRSKALILSGKNWLAIFTYGTDNRSVLVNGDKRARHHSCVMIRERGLMALSLIPTVKERGITA